ncbi:hypothetical protein D9M71_575750 [compost metagenome]
MEASFGGAVAKARDGEPVPLGQPTHQKLLREPSASKVDALIGDFLLAVEIICDQLVYPQFKLHGGHFDWCAVLHQQLAALFAGQQPAALIAHYQTAK